MLTINQSLVIAFCIAVICAAYVAYVDFPKVTHLVESIARRLPGRFGDEARARHAAEIKIARGLEGADYAVREFRKECFTETGLTINDGRTFFNSKRVRQLWTVYEPAFEAAQTELDREIGKARGIPSTVHFSVMLKAAQEQSDLFAGDIFRMKTRFEGGY